MILLAEGKEEEGLDSHERDVELNSWFTSGAEATIAQSRSSRV